MPSQRKRIGFLPSEEVHDIIDKLCRANEFSQSKVTGLLVEEALRSRGVLINSFSSERIDNEYFINNSFQNLPLSKNNKSKKNSDVYAVNKEVISRIIDQLRYLIKNRTYLFQIRENSFMNVRQNFNEYKHIKGSFRK